MNLTEFEKKLQEHAYSVKDTMTAPFDFKTEELTMENKSFNIKKSIIIAAAIICIIGTTVFAAYRYLSARDAANALGEPEIAQLFGNQTDSVGTITDGGYKITMLGITAGENLNNFKSSSRDVIDERSYAVVAVEKADGTAMTYSDGIMATPLISGQKPWECNIFTLAGGHTEEIIDGILYRIIEFNNIEYFADRTVYMAIYEGFAPSAEIFKMNPDGTIEYNKDYSGAKALFEIPLDKSKADSEKAEELLKKLRVEDTSAGTEIPEDGNTQIQEATFSEASGEIILEAAD